MQDSLFERIIYIEILTITKYKYYENKYYENSRNLMFDIGLHPNFIIVFV